MKGREHSSSSSKVSSLLKEEAPKMPKGVKNLFKSLRTNSLAGLNFNEIKSIPEASINMKNKNGDTLVTAAARKKYFGIVKTLINAKADVDAVSPEDMTALDFALKYRRRRAILMLLLAGAKVRDDDAFRAAFKDISDKKEMKKDVVIERSPPPETELSVMIECCPPPVALETPSVPISQVKVRGLELMFAPREIEEEDDEEQDEEDDESVAHQPKKS